MSEEKIKLQNKKDSQPANFNKYRASKGININNSNNTVNEVIDMSEFITKDVFEQFEKRIEDKIDSIPDRMADKIDAKISGLEARQTKWFVGIATTVGIGVLGIIVGVAGVLVSLFI